MINWLVLVLDNSLANPKFQIVASLLHLRLNFSCLDFHLKLSLGLGLVLALA